MSVPTSLICSVPQTQSGASALARVRPNDGTFQAARDFGAGGRPSYVAAGDFNSDGMSDMAVTNFYSDNVSVLISNTPR